MPETLNTTPFTSVFLTSWGDEYAQGSGPVRCLGVWVREVPNLVNAVGKAGMAVGVILALMLDHTIPGTPEERGLAASLRQG